MSNFRPRNQFNNLSGNFTEEDLLRSGDVNNIITNLNHAVDNTMALHNEKIADAAIPTQHTRIEANNDGVIIRRESDGAFRAREVTDASTANTIMRRNANGNTSVGNATDGAHALNRTVADSRYVRFDGEQSLTGEQRGQARSNIREVIRGNTWVTLWRGQTYEVMHPRINDGRIFAIDAFGFGSSSSLCYFNFTRWNSVARIIVPDLTIDPNGTISYAVAIDCWREGSVMTFMNSRIVYSGGAHTHATSHAIEAGLGAIWRII